MSAKSSEVWPDIKAKLMSFVITDRDDDCWGWSGGLNKDGYGYVNWSHKTYWAHRLSYELHKGPIPKGKCVCHTCDNPWCCKPDHLWAGSTQDNVDDCITKGRRGRPSNTGLKDDEVRQIRRLLAEGRHTQWEIARMFRTSQASVSKIKFGDHFAWLE
jgi:hypothetical protein